VLGYLVLLVLLVLLVVVQSLVSWIDCSWCRMLVVTGHVSSRQARQPGSGTLALATPWRRKCRRQGAAWGKALIGAAARLFMKGTPQQHGLFVALSHGPA
jgi:hypothetical protein